MHRLVLGAVGPRGAGIFDGSFDPKPRGLTVEPLAIAPSVRRHRLLSLVMVLLTLAGAIGILEFLPREYNAYASYVVVNPVPPPTDADVVKDPSLGQVNYNNPYLRFSSEGTVGQVLAARMS